MIEYCDVDDLKPDIAAEIKVILRRSRNRHSSNTEASTEASTEANANTDANTDAAAEGAQGHSSVVVEASECSESEHSAGNFRTFELQEECASWFLLARQAVVDVMFLDSNQLECQAKLNQSTDTTTVSIGVWCVQITFLLNLFSFLFLFFYLCYVLLPRT